MLQNGNEMLSGFEIERLMNNNSVEIKSPVSEIPQAVEYNTYVGVFIQPLPQHLYHLVPSHLVAIDIR